MPFVNATDVWLKQIKEADRLFSEVKKLSEVIENEVHQNKAELRDSMYETYNSIIKELHREFLFFPLNQLTDTQMTRFRTVRNNNLKMNHLLELENFKKYQNDVCLPAGELYFSPKLDGISLICWNDRGKVKFLTRGDNVAGTNKNELMEFFLPDAVVGAQQYFDENPNHLGIRGELILDNQIPSYSKYIRIYDPTIKEFDSEDQEFPDSPADQVSSNVKMEAQVTLYEKVQTPDDDADMIKTEQEKFDIKMTNNFQKRCESCLRFKDRKLDCFHTIDMVYLFSIPCWVEIWIPKKSCKKSECDVICEVPKDFKEKISRKKDVSDSQFVKIREDNNPNDLSKYMLYYRERVSDNDRMPLPKYSPNDFKIRMISGLYQTEIISFSNDSFDEKYMMEINADSCMRRELISGLANRKEITYEHIAYKNHIHWVCYQIYKTPDTLLEGLQKLHDHGLEVVEIFKKSYKAPNTLTTAYVHKFLEKYTKKNFDCDGITIRANTMDFTKIIGLKRTRCETTMIQRIVWKKQSSGRIIPSCEIQPISHNGRVFKTLNMFSFENVCGEMYQAYDTVEVKFVADSPVLHRNLKQKKNIRPDQFRNTLLDLFQENVWTEGAHLYTNMQEIVWFVKKLEIPNIQTAGLLRFLKAYDIDDTASVIVFAKFMVMAYEQLDKIKLKSHQNFITHFIQKLNEHEEFDMAVWAIQIPGIQMAVLKKKFATGIKLTLDTSTGAVKKYEIQDPASFESNPTIIKFKNSIPAFFEYYNYFFNVKKKVRQYS